MHEDRRDSTHYMDCPRYDKHELSREQMIEIARMAVELNDQQRNEQIGRMVTNKFYVLIGAIALGLWMWLTKEGFIK